ncbi:glycosyltransferase [Paenibacillus sp. J2TS4]|uniref:MGDG synthase family glycosyltransferase n=1 Tax=Paenibacillus sp. J2TS4 TaxID=2807194 RepID=UPI001B1A365E|nr:glycosyltransferase [Paenibacillus sp. J2TS4]GIP34043.1 galactosyldiacylglycerol synthase [Paenibacillus sp. J2TS4]
MKGNRQPNILILSGELGDGHKQAAKAILEASRLYGPGVQVKVVDFMEWTHPKLHHIGKYCYAQWVKRFPYMYGFLFQKTRTDNSLSQLFKKIKLFDLDRMLKLLEGVQPTVVVSTFPSAAAAMSVLKSHGLTQVPTVTIITDHTDHSYWIHPYTDRYLVGSDVVRDALLLHNVNEYQISITGIPVRPQFSQKMDRNKLRAKHGIHQTIPTVLVMGGGLGMIGKELTSLLWSDQLFPTPVQFIVVCGHNDKLKQQLELDAKHSPHRVKLTGYIDYVHELMALSDIVITKPGGLTTSEAVAVELPMLLYKPLPGQEQDNAAYWVRSGVAIQAKKEEELHTQLSYALRHPQLLSDMRIKAGTFGAKNAALNAVDEIIRTETAWTAYQLPDAIYAVR